VNYGDAVRSNHGQQAPPVAELIHEDTSQRASHGQSAFAKV
jgi:hypothetical protein